MIKVFVNEETIAKKIVVCIERNTSYIHSNEIMQLVGLAVKGMMRGRKIASYDRVRLFIHAFSLHEGGRHKVRLVHRESEKLSKKSPSQEEYGHSLTMNYFLQVKVPFFIDPEQSQEERICGLSEDGQHYTWTEEDKVKLVQSLAEAIAVAFTGNMYVNGWFTPGKEDLNCLGGIIVRSGLKRQSYSRVPDKKDYIWVNHKKQRGRKEESSLFLIAEGIRKVKAKARQRLGFNTEKEAKKFIEKCNVLIAEEKEAERLIVSRVAEAFAIEEEREIALQLSGSQIEQRGAV